MNGNRSTLGNLAWPGMVAIIASLYAYWSGDRQLDSARPLPADAPPWELPTFKGLHAVHARLWEDPLLVAYQDWQKHQNDYSDAKASLSLGPTYVTSLVSSASTDGDEDLKKNLCTIVTAFPPKWATELGDKPDDVRTLVLPVLMRGSASPEDSDWRRRQAYAVLSGLARCGFKLDFSDRLSYCVIRDFQRYVKAQPALDVSQSRPFPLVVPIKLLTVDPSRFNEEPKGGMIQIDDPASEPNRCQVLLLYVNESQLGADPLTALRGILDEMFGEYAPSVTGLPSGRIVVRVIGPTSSDGIRQYFQPPPSDSSTKPSDWPVRLLSPQATAVWNDPPRPRHGVTIIPVIGDAATLLRAIHNELHVRGLCPDHNDHVTEGGKDHSLRIALITEQDTRYGREIVSAYEHQFGTKNVLTFRYLRGIDGRTWRLSDAAKDSTSTAAENYGAEHGRNDPFTALPDNGEWRWRPEGASQFDYLLRLREELQNRDRELREQGQPGIKAIGIVATDVYDKLLILVLGSRTTELYTCCINTALRFTD